MSNIYKEIVSATSKDEDTDTIMNNLLNLSVEERTKQFNSYLDKIIGPEKPKKPRKPRKTKAIEK